MKQFFKQFFIMSSTIILLISILVISSCGPSKEEVEAKEKLRIESGAGPHYITMVRKYNEYNFANPVMECFEADGCEYLGTLNVGSGDVVTHKGNCKYCHKRDSLLLESILQRFFQTSKH